MSPIGSTADPACAAHRDPTLGTRPVSPAPYENKIAARRRRSSHIILTASHRAEEKATPIGTLVRRMLANGPRALDWSRGSRAADAPHTSLVQG